MLIGDAISVARNVTKILTYKEFTIETRRMWNVITELIPVKKTSNGPISKSFRKYLNNIPRKHDNQGTTQNSHKGAMHRVFRKVLT